MSVIGDSAINPKALVGGLWVTGDSKSFVAQRVLGSLFANFPSASISSLTTGSNPVNRYSVSGKDLGTLVIGAANGKATLMVSAGKAEVAKWVTIKDLLGTQATITPNAPAISKSIIGDVTAINELAYEGITLKNLMSVSLVDLLNINAPINQPSLSGKSWGSLVMVTTDSATAIYASGGSDATSSWKNLVIIKGVDATLVEEVVPVGAALPQSSIGDITQTISNKQGVVLHALPVYIDTGYLVKGSVENATHESGKSLGSMVVLYDKTKANYGLYMSAGDTDISPWILLVALKGAPATITPA